MIFIVDTNIVFSGLLRDSVTRELLIDCPFTLYAPENLILEIRKYENEIIRRSGFTKQEFEILFSLLIENINIIEKEKYQANIEEANELIGHRPLPKRLATLLCLNCQTRRVVLYTSPKI